MKKTIKYLSLLSVISASLFLGSCRQVEKISDELDIPGLGGYDYKWTELDYWLDDTFRKPYNIQVTYRWNAVQQINITSRKLVPAKVEDIKPMMDALSRVWFGPYLAAAPYGFLQQVAPKTVVLTGSPEYDQYGSVTLGQAEGGRKIWLTNVNFFDATDVENIKGSLHVIEHEFTHVLHQTKLYPYAFNEISTGLYDAVNWKNFTGSKHVDIKAYAQGFISAYAMSSPDEDFAEMVSRLLVYGPDWFESVVIANAAKASNNPRPTAVADLRAKVSIVETYMKENWGITFFDKPGETGLVTYVKDAIEDLLANPLVEEPVNP